jgi:hypothetical protein
MNTELSPSINETSARATGPVSRRGFVAATGAVAAAASVLADQRSCGASRCGSYAAGHVFGSVRHLDGAANGDWRAKPTL